VVIGEIRVLLYFHTPNALMASGVASPSSFSDPKYPPNEKAGTIHTGYAE